MQRRILQMALVVAAVLAAGVVCAADRPTEPFRREHAEIKPHLEHVRTWAGSLATQKPEERRATMKKILRFFDQHIRAHAAWEEKVLYPAVDRRAGNATYLFTSTMRYEHKVIARYIDELGALAAAAKDAVAFQRRTDNLLGLLGAHFEEEEEVLLPILDKTMSAADFEREIGHVMEHG